MLEALGIQYGVDGLILSEQMSRVLSEGQARVPFGFPDFLLY